MQKQLKPGLKKKSGLFDKGISVIINIVIGFFLSLVLNIFFGNIIAAHTKYGTSFGSVLILLIFTIPPLFISALFIPVIISSSNQNNFSKSTLSFLVLFVAITLFYLLEPDPRSPESYFIWLLITGEIFLIAYFQYRFTCSFCKLNIKFNNDTKIENNVDTSENFRRLVNKNWPGSLLIDITEMKGGISKNMSLLRIRKLNGTLEKFIVRQFETEKSCQHEYNILNIVSKIKTKTPNPILIDITCEILSKPYLILEHIEGGLSFDNSDADNYISELADRLAEIHCIPLTDEDKSKIPDFRNHYNEYVSTLPEINKDRFREKEIRDILQSKWKIKTDTEPVLIHGDFWPGNVLWSDGNLNGIIDWEDSGIGYPLHDLAIARLEISWIFGIEAKEKFTEIYKKNMKLDYNDLPFWDLFAALRFSKIAGNDIQKFSDFFHPYGREDITEKNIIDNCNIFIVKALNQIED